jgi:TrmH family RNA methyltransferase
MKELPEALQKKSRLAGVNDQKVKDARDMLLGRYKGDDGLFICEGLWAAEKLLSKGLEIETVYYDSVYFSPEGKCTEEELRQLTAVAGAAAEVLSVSPKACARISDRDGADVCFIVARLPEYDPEALELRDDMLVMILDGQEQPGNIGAILRSLDAAGGDFAIVTHRRVKLTHPRLIRSSLGSAFMMPFFEMPFEKLTAWLQDKGFRTVLTDLTATKNFCDISPKGRIAVVAGNEHTGISPEWREIKGSEPVIIPMLGSVESLNVGFASTLVAYNIGLRQKGLM